jgi:thiol-disulfide isomerase/thioredoxin
MANKKRNPVLPRQVPANGRPGAPPRPSQQRARPTRQPRRRGSERKRWVPAVIIAVVVVAIVGIVVGKLATSSSGKVQTAAGEPVSSFQTPAPASVMSAVTDVPLSTIVGETQGSASVVKPTPIQGGPLTSDGKPEVLYIGAEYCPYCAAERWAVVMALSKFGTFSNLSVTHSSSIDVDPNTPSFAFFGSTYTSPYITFVAVEETTNQPSGNSYRTLQTPTAAEQALISKYDTSGGIPFIDLGGQAKLSTQYDPAIFKGLSVSQAAEQVADPSTQIAHDVDAAAGVIIAQICKMTGGKGPPGVCSAVSGLA